MFIIEIECIFKVETRQISHSSVLGLTGCWSFSQSWRRGGVTPRTHHHLIEREKNIDTNACSQFRGADQRDIHVFGAFEGLGWNTKRKRKNSLELNPFSSFPKWTVTSLDSKHSHSHTHAQTHGVFTKSLMRVPAHLSSRQNRDCGVSSEMKCTGPCRRHVSRLVISCFQIFLFPLNDGK